MLPKQLWWNECDYKHNKRKNKALVQQLTHYERKTKLLHYQRAPGIIARDNVTDNSNSSSNTNIECYRGLECMIDGGRRRSSIHRAAHAAVRLEQARQQLDGPTASNNNIVEHNERQQQQPKIKTTDDIIRLAEIYSTYCMKSTIEAKRLGRIDAKEAKVALETDWEVVNNIPTTGCTISTYDVNNNNNKDDDNDFRKSVSGNSNSTSALSITPTTTQKSDTDNNCDKGTTPSLTATTTKMSTSSHDDNNNNNDNDDDIHNTTNGGGRIIVYQRYQAERRTNSTSRSKNHKRFKRAFTLLRMNPNRP